ncbi:DEKNAAC103807 [Brettanomyces naardenensis]|uniref:DEKNAAC103807 n=1 Tax=Brettanomyces naardenensis TaxID=13370 RepID=A0A448YP83_BRENA|nr:DEKNAAC103807 [Brettanomyces naardenensis]
MCRSTVLSKPFLDVKLRKILTEIIDSIVEGDPGRKVAIEKFVKEKNEDYEKDSKAEGPLFEKTFVKFSEAVIDSSDGVPRCSVCHWEVHGSTCDNCGRILVRNSQRGGLANEMDSEDEDFEEGSEFVDRALNHFYQMQRVLPSAIADLAEEDIDEDVDDADYDPNDDHPQVQRYEWMDTEGDDSEDTEDDEFIDHRPLEEILQERSTTDRLWPTDDDDSYEENEEIPSEGEEVGSDDGVIDTRSRVVTSARPAQGSHSRRIEEEVNEDEGETLNLVGRRRPGIIVSDTDSEDHDTVGFRETVRRRNEDEDATIENRSGNTLIPIETSEATAEGINGAAQRRNRNRSRRNKRRRRRNSEAVD